MTQQTMQNFSEAINGLAGLRGVYSEDEIRGIGLQAVAFRETYPTLSAQMANQIALVASGKDPEDGFYTLDVDIGGIEKISTGTSPTATLNTNAITFFAGKNRTLHLCDLQDGETQSEEPVLVEGIGFEFVNGVPNAGYTALTEVAGFFGGTTAADQLALRTAQNTVMDAILTGFFNKRALLFEKRVRYLNSGGALQVMSHGTPATGALVMSQPTIGMPAKVFRHELSEKFILVNGKKFSCTLQIPMGVSCNLDMGARVVLMGKRILRGAKL